MEVQRDLLKKDKHYATFAFLTKTDLEGLIKKKLVNQLSRDASNSSGNDCSQVKDEDDLEEKKENTPVFS